VEQHIHRAASRDGTEIAGRVHGEGPPVVLLHGRLDDGDTAWDALLPPLARRFTCFLPSTRGRGLSSDHPDHTPARLIEDVTAFAESIGEPVGVAGWSMGASLALAAAARTDTFTAVAAYEPTAPEVMDDDTRARLGAVVGRVVDLAGQDRMVDAARVFHEPVTTADEMAAAEDADLFKTWARYVPTLVREYQQAADVPDPSPTDPLELAKVTVPTLILRGSQTPLGWFADSVRHIAAHVANADVREVRGAGHLGPALRPQPIAEELVRMFTNNGRTD
jgi:pimeloyl-ACP methyl ester carboxylesterase